MPLSPCSIWYLPDCLEDNGSNPQFVEKVWTTTYITELCLQLTTGWGQEMEKTINHRITEPQEGDVDHLGDCTVWLMRLAVCAVGQKPFRCPQCPVTFSTKSNRERHMIRKHGLDMHDPATRQMMDRPFKCHLCVFSSFSSSGTAHPLMIAFFSDAISKPNYVMEHTNVILAYVTGIPRSFS